MKKFISIALILLVVLSFGSTFADNFKIDIVPGEINEYSRIFPYGESVNISNKCFYGFYDYDTGKAETGICECDIGYILPVGLYKVTNNLPKNFGFAIYSLESYWDDGYEEYDCVFSTPTISDEKNYGKPTFKSLKPKDSIEVKVDKDCWVWLGYHNFPITHIDTQYVTFEKID